MRKANVTNCSYISKSSSIYHLNILVSALIQSSDHKLVGRLLNIFPGRNHRYAGMPVTPKVHKVNIQKVLDFTLNTREMTNLTLPAF